jgi:hypothetical protein
VERTTEGVDHEYMDACSDTQKGEHEAALHDRAGTLVGTPEEEKTC